jgi:protein-tyrosine kinase
MSRIHEALKKAAQERSEQLSGRSAQDLLEIVGEAPLEPLAPAAAGLETLNPNINKGLSRGTSGEAAFNRLVAQCRRVEWKIEPRFSVFANEANDRVGAERFRTLRSRLYQIAAAQTVRRVLLTSSVPEEGKTFIASNLAQSMVRQTDRRVLLIDGDLRASRLHLMLGATNVPGLTDYLRGEMDETKVMQVGREGNLCFIPGGKQVSNPSELLHSDRMKALLDKMTPLFDWIIVDSPPAIAVHDASILADMCDGVLFVVRAGSTDFELAQKAAAEFQEKSLLGVVLNRVEKLDTYGEYYYGYSSSKDEA